MCRRDAQLRWIPIYKAIELQLSAVTTPAIYIKCFGKVFLSRIDLHDPSFINERVEMHIVNVIKGLQLLSETVLAVVSLFETDAIIRDLITGMLANESSKIARENFD